jgi:small-conductance mechanosensitive channel
VARHAHRESVPNNPGPDIRPDPLEQERRQRKPSRPLQAIFALAVAVAAAVGVHLYGVPLAISSDSQAARLGFSKSPYVTFTEGRLITFVGTVVFLVFGLISTFAFARWAKAVLGRFVGLAYGEIVRYVMILFGGGVVFLTTLAMLGFRVSQLLLGGAVTGVLITIAAQQSLQNMFAGMMLHFSQPFTLGDRIRVTSAALLGTIEGTVTEFNTTHVRLETDDGRVFLPNSQVLAAAVGRVRGNGAQAESEPAPPGPMIPR